MHNKTVLWAEHCGDGSQPKAGRPRAEVDNTNIMYYVYIIQSIKNKKLYKGFTSDLKQRLQRHNAGQVASTKAFIPWKLIYYEAFLHKTDTLKEELFLKSGKGKERIKYLFTNIK